nr:DUF3784 domain-containing protein [uncultured Cohaesibacter sp.]
MVFLLILAVLGFVLAIGFFAIQTLKLHSAKLLFRSGAFNRLNAVRKIASAQIDFLRTVGLFLFAFTWGGAFLLFLGLGFTAPSFLLAGALIGVGAANLIGAIYAKASIFRFIACKENIAAPTSWAELVQYVILPNRRLAFAVTQSRSDLASLLAILAYQDAQKSGTPLRIQEFGVWPGLSYARELKLRVVANIPLLASGAIVGLVVGALMILVIGPRYFDDHLLPNWLSFAPHFVSSELNESVLPMSGKPDLSAKVAGQTVAPESNSQGQLSNGQVEGYSLSLDKNAQGASAQSQRTGSNSSSSTSEQDTDTANSQSNMSQSQNRSAKTMAQDRNSASEPSQSGQQSASGDGGAGQGGSSQNGPQALSEVRTDFPQRKNALNPIEIEGLNSDERQSQASGAQQTGQEIKGRERNGRAGDQEHETTGGRPPSSADVETSASFNAGNGKHSKEQAENNPYEDLQALSDEAITSLADTSAKLSLHRNEAPVADRGAKAFHLQEIHAKSANRDTNIPARPHVPQQQVPQWMKSLIGQQSK